MREKYTTKNEMCNPGGQVMSECSRETNMIQASNIRSQEITLPLETVAFPSVDIQIGNAISYDLTTNSFMISQAGVYQISWKSECMKTAFGTTDLGLVLAQDQFILLFDSRVRQIVTSTSIIVPLTNTYFLQTDTSTQIQLLTATIDGDFSNSVMSILKVG